MRRIRRKDNLRLFALTGWNRVARTLACIVVSGLLVFGGIPAYAASSSAQAASSSAAAASSAAAPAASASSGSSAVASQGAQQPTPEPEPEPTPQPEPQPESTPEPEPEPTPQLEPTPAPESTPAASQDSPQPSDSGSKSSGSENPSGQSSPSSSSAPAEQSSSSSSPSAAEERPHVVDVGIYIEASNDCLATSFGDYTQQFPELAEKAQINSKGGTLSLDSILFWDSGDQERNSTNVTWKSSDEKIASFVGGTGQLRAHADGTVVVRATVDKSYVDGGKTMFAEATVKVAGQSDSLYVKENGIRIYSPDGEDVTNSVMLFKEDLSQAQVQFSAEVDVVDPATDKTTTYSTKKGKLSEQVPSLGDLVWTVGDPSLAAIMDDTGLFRPSKHAMVAVSVESRAGFGGATVTASTVVNTESEDEGEQEADEYHPQDSLTIKAYYGGPDARGNYYTPDTIGDEAYVIDREYSLGELQSFGQVTAYYSATNSTGDYYTMCGTGVPFSSVLRDAGINLEGIDHFAFRTADWPYGENRPVTYSFVFADRYFYPNFDIGGSLADAVQVYPILAWESSQIRNSVNLNIPMTEATRFRLLFGSTPDGGNSQYQIKWINTIVVVLAGGPPVSDGEGDGGDNGDTDIDGEQGGTTPGGDGKPTDDAQGAGNGPSSSASSSSASSGNASASSASASSSSSSESSSSSSAAAQDPEKNDNDTRGAGNQATQQEEKKEERKDDEEESEKKSEEASPVIPEGAATIQVGDTAGLDSSVTGTGGSSYNIYQVMNSNASQTDTEVVHENPFRPYAIPLGAAAMAAGGLEALLWFRLQRKGLQIAIASIGGGSGV